jgi:transcription elongation factor Elf1
MSAEGVLRTIPDKAEEKYVQCCLDGVWKCPCCGSDGLEWDSLDAQGNQVVQEVSCSDCGLEWRDIYVISRVDIKGFERIPVTKVQ